MQVKPTHLSLSALRDFRNRKNLTYPVFRKYLFRTGSWFWTMFCSRSCPERITLLTTGTGDRSWRGSARTFWKKPEFQGDRLTVTLQAAWLSRWTWPIEAATLTHPTPLQCQLTVGTAAERCPLSHLGNIRYKTHPCLSVETLTYQCITLSVGTQWKK